MSSKKLQMFTAVTASILLGIGLATVPASAKSGSNKEVSAHSAQASSKEKKPSKETAKKETSKQTAKKGSTKEKSVGQGGSQGGGGGGKY